MLRTDRVWLARGEPRCDPSRPCLRANICARRMATINPGDPVADLSGRCHVGWSEFIQAGPPPVPVAEPRPVHPSVPGLSLMGVA